MRFEGQTVLEAMSKAIRNTNAPASFNLKRAKSKSKIASHPKSSTDDNQYNKPETISRAREIAISKAMSFIRNVDVSEGANERAIVFLFNTANGQTRYLIDSNAGHVELGGGGSSFSSDNRHFRFEFNWRPRSEIILVTAHSHPAANRAGGWQLRQNADQIDRLNENIRRNQLDTRLLNIAPTVIKTPSGQIKLFKKPGGYD